MDQKDFGGHSCVKLYSAIRYDKIPGLIPIRIRPSRLCDCESKLLWYRESTVYMLHISQLERREH